MYLVMYRSLSDYQRWFVLIDHNKEATQELDHFTPIFNAQALHFDLLLPQGCCCSALSAVLTSQEKS